MRHVVYWCDDARAHLAPSGGTGSARAEPADDADWPPVPPGLDEPQWQRIVEGLIASHRALVNAVKLLSPDRLAARVPGRNVTFEDMLRGVVEHAAYHGGQIAILKRKAAGA